MRRALCVILSVFPAMAGEYIVLKNGFRIRADRHETRGADVIVHTGPGSMQVRAADVERYEQDDWTPPPPPPAPAAASVPVAQPVSPRELIDRAAERQGIPKSFLHSVAKAESAYRTDAVSPKGAVGVMQLMPGTAAALGADPKDPEQNIEAGARHLTDLLVKYKDHPDQVRLALAAYNAGEGAVARHKGVPPYEETRLYVEKVLRSFRKAGRK